MRFYHFFLLFIGFCLAACNDRVAPTKAAPNMDALELEGVSNVVQNNQESFFVSEKMVPLQLSQNTSADPLEIRRVQDNQPAVEEKEEEKPEWVEELQDKTYSSKKEKRKLIQEVEKQTQSNKDLIGDLPSYLLARATDSKTNENNSQVFEESLEDILKKEDAVALSLINNEIVEDGEKTIEECIFSIPEDNRACPLNYY